MIVKVTSYYCVIIIYIYIYTLTTLTFRGWKPMPTAKLATQLMSTAMDIAAGLGPWLKSSAVIIHGMEPGPTAKNTTNPSMDTTAKYDIQSIISCTKPKNS